MRKPICWTSTTVSYTHLDVYKRQESARADKEFGGEKLDENLAIAKTALDKFATPEFTKLLNDTGLGNHPEVLRVFVRAGKAISPDSVIPGKAAPSPADRLSALYDNTPKS